MPLIVDSLEQSTRRVEVVERKGIGHPDTLCDALADQFERALSRFYRDEFGRILHHNVDKALLIGGAARAAFGGGVVDAPMELVLAGRATTEVGGRRVPVEEIARSSVQAWLRQHMHALDPERHVTLRCAIRGGSAELTGLFARSRPLANDTSIGVGYWPLSLLEQQVLDIERHVNDPAVKAERPELGEDVKVLGVSVGEVTSFTVGCAMIDRYLSSLDDYRDATTRLAQRLSELAGDQDVVVNAGDDLARGEIYLTVTGTSAESGDDGEVGRGNRGNGLITPFRPMTLETIAGKNPVTHVGKLYNVVATRMARSLVESLEAVDRAQVCLASRIGSPIEEPPLVWLGIGSARPVAELETEAAEVAHAILVGLPRIWSELIDGTETYW
ncbi:MAG: methionine adenosyltransferase [Pseudomonadales bacterium]